MRIWGLPYKKNEFCEMHFPNIYINERWNWTGLFTQVVEDSIYGLFSAWETTYFTCIYFFKSAEQICYYIINYIS